MRTAISRSCRDAGVPHFGRQALRHWRISLLHRQGISWAEIGERAGQRRLVTAGTCSHALTDSREVDRGKRRAFVRQVPTAGLKTLGFFRHVRGQ